MTVICFIVAIVYSIASCSCKIPSSVRRILTSACKILTSACRNTHANQSEYVRKPIEIRTQTKWNTHVNQHPEGGILRTDVRILHAEVTKK